MSLTYDQKRAILHHLAQENLWQSDNSVVERIMAHFYERQDERQGGRPAAAPGGNAAPESAAPLWSHFWHTIDFSYRDFPWLQDGKGTDRLALVTAYDLGIDRSLPAHSMAKKLGADATSAFVPWTLTTEFNGCNIGFSNRFGLETYREEDGLSGGIRLRTDMTGKYAILAKAQLCGRARQDECPAQDWTGGFFLPAALKALAAAPGLTVAGAERNVWRAFALRAADEAGLRAALLAAHDTLGRNLGLDPASYAAVNDGGGRIVLAVEQGEYERLAAAAAISLRALHAIRTGQCDDWQALGRAMAAQHADLKYADPDAALGRQGKLKEDGVKSFADLMRVYKRDELLRAYQSARDDRENGAGRHPDAPAP